MRIFLPIFVSLYLLSAPIESRAQSGGSDPYFVCRAVSGGVTALAGVPLMALPRYAAIGMFIGGATSAGFNGPLSERCSEALDEFNEHYMENPVEYDEFVETTCGGNPWNCPGTLSPFYNDPIQNPWDDPNSCWSILDCMAPGFVKSTQQAFSPIVVEGMSINDIITLIDYAYDSEYAGVWLPAPSFPPASNCGTMFDCIGQ